RWGGIYLYRLTDPRPFAQVMCDVAIMDDAAALAMLRSPTVDLRHTLVLEHDPGVATSDTALQSAPQPAVVSQFTPEQITIEASASAEGMLSVSLPYYPGWSATVDGQ